MVKICEWLSIKWKRLPHLLDPNQRLLLIKFACSVLINILLLFSFDVSKAADISRPVTLLLMSRAAFPLNKNLSSSTAYCTRRGTPFLPLSLLLCGVALYIYNFPSVLYMRAFTFFSPPISHTWYIDSHTWEPVRHKTLNLTRKQHHVSEIDKAWNMRYLLLTLHIGPWFYPPLKGN